VAEQAVQQGGVRGGKLDELETVDAQGIVLNFGHGSLRRDLIRGRVD
jgi:hypothetical protein